MKKTLILALATIFVMALASCGGNASNKTTEDGDNTEATVKLDGKGSLQFQECKAVYKQMEKDIKKAKTCEDLKGTMEYLLTNLPLFKDYAEGDGMTEEELGKLEEIADGVKAKYSKAEADLCK